MRLRRLDLNLLVMLDILIAEGSVSQTAERLGITQPAISNALARLRAHFNDELFVLLDRRMVPTPFCRELAEPVRRIIAELGVIASARADFDPATAERTVTIICSDYVFLVYLAGVVRTLSTLAPGVRVRTMLTNEKLGDLLGSGRADFCIVPDQRTIAGLPTAALFQDEFVIVAWSGNSVIGEALSAEQYFAARHVSTTIGTETTPLIEHESLSRAPAQRNIAVYAPHFTAMADVIVGTDLIATMHGRAARILASRMPLRILPPPVAIAPFTVCLQWHGAMAGDQGMTWVRELLIDSAPALRHEQGDPA